MGEVKNKKKSNKNTLRCSVDKYSSSLSFIAVMMWVFNMKDLSFDINPEKKNIIHVHAKTPTVMQILNTSYKTVL